MSKRVGSVHAVYNGTTMRAGTYESAEECAEGRGHLPVPPDEDGVRGALQLAAPRRDTEVAHGANHVVEAHEVRAPEQAEDDRAEERADKTLHRLLRGQLDERGTADGDTPDVSEYIVTDDEGGGDPEPDQTLKNVVHDEVAMKAS